ncbi:MAG TPA: family 16 glycosylhydrolase [Prolixibacteraceae bacterium]|nr:family 16 glycosylhydrolase [Prolixibacteraceae bacterium]
MKKVIFILAISYFALTSVKAQTVGEPVLTWSDEFDGAAGVPDPKKWDRPEYNRKQNPNGPDGWWSKEDSFVDGKGNLVITVRKIPNKNGDADAFDYSSGALRTMGKFTQLYGRYEIRCQLPKQQGWWVAFWMMQGNVGSILNKGVDGSEVDIMEGFGWTDKINYAIHYDGYGDAHKSVGKNELIAGIRNGYHIYSMDWYPDKYVFYVDGKERWRSTGGGVCNKPGYVKVTAEISTEDWAINQWWSNDPAKATYPDSFKVDYVRVYQFPTTTSTNSLKQEEKTMNIYPNPANEIISVDLPEKASGNEKPDVQIISSAGTVVKSFRQVNNPLELPVSDLRRGLYFLTVKFKDSSYTQKFMKN